MSAGAIPRVRSWMSLPSFSSASATNTTIPSAGDSGEKSVAMGIWQRQSEASTPASTASESGFMSRFAASLKETIDPSQWNQNPIAKAVTEWVESRASTTAASTSAALAGSKSAFGSSMAALSEKLSWKADKEVTDVAPHPFVN